MRAYNEGMDKAAFLEALAEGGAPTRRAARAVLFLYQLSAALLFAALPFFSSAWFNSGYLAGLVFLGAGVWIRLLASHGRAHAVFMVFATSAALTLAGSPLLAASAGGFLLWSAAASLSSGTLLHLALVYPEESRIFPRMSFLPWLFYLLTSGPTIFALLFSSSYAEPNVQNAVRMWSLSQTAFAVVLYLSAAAFRRIRARSPLTVEKSRFVLWTGLISFVPPSLWVLAEALPIIPGNLPSAVALLPAALFPLGLAFALQRYRLVETDYVLSRVVLYTLMSLMGGAAYVLVVSGLSLLSGTLFAADDPFLLGVVVVLFILSIRPLQTRLERFTNQLFQRDADAAARIASFRESIQDSQDITLVTDELWKALDENLQPRRAHIFLHEAGTNLYYAARKPNREKTTDLRFKASNSLVKTLAEQESAIFIESDKPFPAAFQADQARLALLGGRLFVAMPGLLGLSGWIALGEKRSGTPYTRQEIDFLVEIGSLAGYTIERAQILADKTRRDHEMEVLTRVAQGVTVTVVFDDIMELIFAQTEHLLSLSDFNISLYNPTSQVLMHALYVEKGVRDKSAENRELNPKLGLEMEVIKRRRALISDDYSKTCGDLGLLSTRPGLLSWLGVPLNTGAETIGMIGVGSHDPAVIYNQEQAVLLQAVADQAAGAIVKARLLEESEKRARQLATLNEVARSLTTTLEIDPLLHRILDNAASILNCEAGSLLLVDQETGELVFEVTVGPVAEDLIGRRLEPGVGLVGKSVITRQPIIQNEVEKSKVWSKKTDQQTGFVTRDLLVVPMMVKDRVIGVIEVMNKFDHSPFNLEDQELLMAFTGQASILVENARLYTMTDQKLASRVEELSVMQRIDRELNTTLDVGKAMQIALHWALQQSKAHSGLIGLLTPDGLQVAASEGYEFELDTYQIDPIPLELPAIREAIASAETQKPPSEELRAGAAIWAEAQAQLVIPIRREEQVIGLLILESSQAGAFGEDIENFLLRLSDHAAIAIANAQLYQELQQVNIAKSDFVSFVSHELKTPMTSIKGYTDLLAAESVGPVNPAQQNFLDTIRSNVERMTTLVTDLADISRIEAGRMQLEFSAVPINEVIEEVVASAQAMLDEKEQQLEINVPGQLPLAWGDRTRAAQVLTNLVSNAIKYTPEKGRIVISSEQTENVWDPEVASKVVHLSVTDNGIGIKEGDQKQIFQQYFRTEDGKEFAPGTGLGLNIARNLVEMQGGKIWFESTYRQGTTFHFTIPIAESHLQQPD